MGTDVAIILLIFSNLDRLIACWNPLRASRYCTVRIALLEIAGVTCFAVLLNITTPIIRTITYPSAAAPPTRLPLLTTTSSTSDPTLNPKLSSSPLTSSLLIYSSHTPTQTNPICTDKVESHPLNWYQQRMQPWLVLVLVSVVPELCVLTFNVLLLAGLARHERRLRAFALIRTVHTTIEANGLARAVREATGDGARQKRSGSNASGQQLNSSRAEGDRSSRPQSFSVLPLEQCDREKRIRAETTLEVVLEQATTAPRTQLHFQTAFPDTKPKRSTTLELPKLQAPRPSNSSPNILNSAESDASHITLGPSSLNVTPNHQASNGNVKGSALTDPIAKRNLLADQKLVTSQSTAACTPEPGPPLVRHPHLELNQSKSAMPRVASAPRLREGSSPPGPAASALSSYPRGTKRGSSGANGNLIGAPTGNQSSGGTGGSKDRERTTYVLTLGISLLFLVLYTPILLLRPFEEYFVDKALYRQLQTLLSMLQHTFHCADFYVYVAISRAYRQKLLRVLLGRRFIKSKWGGGGGVTDGHQSRGATETQTAPPMQQFVHIPR